MFGLSPLHWIVVLVVVLLVFGRGRISDVMGDFGKGISSFKKGMAEAEKEPEAKPVKQIAAPPVEGPAAPVRTPEEEDAAKRDPGG
jgi:sec-independent protein translocase protein TatA